MCGLNSILNRLFDDRRLIVTILMLWVLAVVVGFSHLGLLDTNYTTMGPSPHTVFMTITLDTWKKWSLVAIYTVISTCIGDFAGDSMSQFYLNIVQDPKTKYIPYQKFTCILITQFYTIYGSLMGVIRLHLILSRVDFVIIRLLTDLFTNVWTQSRMLQYKHYDPIRYTEMELHIVSKEDSGAPLIQPNKTTETCPDA